MVAELKVREVPKPKYSQDQEDQLLWEYVYEGVPIPDDLEESLRERSGIEWLYSEQANRSAEAAAAAMEWDAWHLELEREGR